MWAFGVSDFSRALPKKVYRHLRGHSLTFFITQTLLIGQGNGKDRIAMSAGKRDVLQQGRRHVGAGDPPLRVHQRARPLRKPRRPGDVPKNLWSEVQLVGEGKGLESRRSSIAMPQRSSCIFFARMGAASLVVELQSSVMGCADAFLWCRFRPQPLAARLPLQELLRP